MKTWGVHPSTDQPLRNSGSSKVNVLATLVQMTRQNNQIPAANWDDFNRKKVWRNRVPLNHVPYKIDNFRSIRYAIETQRQTFIDVVFDSPNISKDTEMVPNADLLQMKESTQFRNMLLTNIHSSKPPFLHLLHFSIYFFFFRKMLTTRFF